MALHGRAPSHCSAGGAQSEETPNGCTPPDPIRGNKCLLGCRCPCSDKIEHYLQYPVYRTWLASEMPMDLPAIGCIDEWFLVVPLTRL